jgi:hypothetical protein
MCPSCSHSSDSSFTQSQIRVKKSARHFRYHYTLII